MNYFEWNNLLAEYFFNENRAHEETVIYVTEDTLKGLGIARGSSLDDFINAIRAGPYESHKEEICEDALLIYQNWRTNASFKFPPYIAYLCFFVLVAATEDHDFAPHAYYPKMWKILGYEGKRDTPSK